MIKVFRDKKTGDYLVESNCLDIPAFIADLSEALSNIKNGGAEEYMAVLTQAMPIAYKLSGYKADEVSERRTLICGRCSPQDSSLVVSVGNGG